MATCKCAQCKETVYPLEKIVLAEKPFHRGCAKCSHCQGTLTISSFASADGKLFCKPHFMELFKSTGGKYAFTAQNGEAPVTAPKPKVETKASEEKSSTPKKLAKLASFVAGNAFKAADDAKNKKETKVASTPAKQPEQMIVPVEEAQKVKEPVQVKPVEAPKPVEIPKPVEAPKPAGNRLAAFLSGSSSSAASEPVTVPAPVQVVEQVNAPVVVASAPVQQNASGLSKLSMFLQQVEGNAPVVPQTTTVKTTQSQPQSIEVAREKQASVSDLIQKTETKPAKKDEVKASALPSTIQREESVAAPKEPEVAKPAPKEVKPEPAASRAPSTESAQAQSESSLLKIKERLAMAKATIATANASMEAEENAKLKAELDSYRSRCAELEAENLTLRARVQLSDSGKEALVQEIARLNAVILAQATVAPQSSSSSFRLTKVPFAEQTNNNENDANHVDASLKHAKKLLAQGKISKAQYDAAVRASVEANRAIMGA